MNILAELKTKIGADKDRLTRALALLSDDPTRTLEQILALSATPPPPAAPVVPPAPAAKPVFAVVVEKIADKDLRSRAFAILAEHPEFHYEQVEAALAAEDRAELKRLREESAALKKQLAEKEQIIASLRDDGHPAPLKLGVPGSGSGEQKQSPAPTGLARTVAAFRANDRNPANAARN